MKDYSKLNLITQDKINELKRKQKLTLPVGSDPEYFRLQAKIHYLRNGPSSIYAWRNKNSKRIKYERACGIAYTSKRRAKLLTEKQRLARNQAVIRHDAKNPQRKIRRNIERILLMFYAICAMGKKTGKRPRLRIQELLGCGPDEFREHIRQQLARNGWLWSEWKEKWTMDHVVPVRKFNLPIEEQACWHYTNLRPLAKKLNHRHI